MFGACTIRALTIVHSMPACCAAAVAPRSSVQIIVAALFALAMLLLTLQTQPYRAASSNQLAALSQINVRARAAALCARTRTRIVPGAHRRCVSTTGAQIFLFLFVGLLLNTDPDGIAKNSVMFAVFVGLLTTSIGARARACTQCCCHLLQLTN
jgi:hypothetical protein